MSDFTRQMHDLFERHHQFQMESSPEFATYEGDHRYNDRLSDLSAAAHERQLKTLQGFYAELQALPKAQLSAEDQLNHEMFELMLSESIADYCFRPWEMPLNQMTGYQLSLPQLIDFQPLHSEADYAAYFQRLRGFEQQVADVLDNLRAGMQSGRVQPRHLMEQVLPQLDQLMSGKAEDSVWMLPLQKSTLNTDTRERLGRELAQIIAEVVQPGYQAMHNFVRDHYLAACRESVGVWDLPDGEAFYEHLIAMYTEPGRSADEIHAIGLQEVARIHKAKEALKNQLGFDGSVEDFNQHLRSQPQFYFDSVDELWAAYEAVMAEAYVKTPALFHRMPAAPCVLKAVEDYKAKSAPQAYYMPAPEDGSRPGYYYINTYDLSSRPRYAVTALTLHEAIPGHHLQIALAQELHDLPYFRRRMHVTAYIEGWGLYSEYLGYEMDMYQDPYQHYGALGFEMWRACRLVVDTGLHAKKWSRQQAIDFMKHHMANSEHDIAAEVDRYMILPGQALSYKIGELKLRALRQQAESQLGQKFDLRDFHDVVLRNGAVPLAVLGEQVEHWLQKA